LFQKIYCIAAAHLKGINLF